MVRIVLRSGEDEHVVVVGLSEVNVARLKIGEPITFPMGELVAGWNWDMWLADLATSRGRVKILANLQQYRTQRSQVVLGLDRKAFEKLDSTLPRQAVFVTLKDPWKGRVYLVKGNSEKSILEEWAPLIALSPDAVIKVDERNL